LPEPAPAATAIPAAPADIAAAALASVQHSPLRTRPRQATARPADELIGASISDLVDHAARKQARALRDARGDAPTGGSGGGRPSAASAIGSDRLRATLAEIERAAADAREQARLSRHPMPPLRDPSRERGHTGPTAKSAPMSAPETGPAPVVEVYRAPRVEVYRRRPDGSGSFERQ
jgi:branched-chain amino acid transport system ATP-binding protein